MKAICHLCLTLLGSALGFSVFARQDALITDAVKHRIDRRAMVVPISGWSRDLRFPVYPIQVQAGTSGVYYVTKPSVATYQEFGFDALRCEIGDADKAVLKLPGYSCVDGVCMTKEGAILGTDPVNQKHCC